MKYINIEFTNGTILKLDINRGWFDKEMAYWTSPNRKNVKKVWVD